MAGAPTAAGLAVRAAFPALAAMPHIVRMVEQCLDYSVRFSLDQASARGDVRLLERVAARSAALLEPGAGRSRDEQSEPASRCAFTLALCRAARHGHVSCVQWLVERFSGVLVDASGAFDGDVTGAMVQAARHGHLSVLQWLYARVPDRIQWRTKMTVVAAIEGHFEVVRWLLAHSTAASSTFVMDYAADHGDLEMLAWLKAHSAVGCSKYAMDNAARRGNLAVVQWLHENCEEGCTVGAMDDAAMEGHLHVLQWLHTHRSEGCSDSALHLAAVNGHANTVKWLLANYRQGDARRAFNSAVQWRHAQVARVLGEHLSMPSAEVEELIAERLRQ